MDAQALVSVVAAALAGVVIGGLIGRRSRDAAVGEARERADRVEAEQETSRLQAEEARRVQDLTLGSMQEGVLLLDGGWRTVFANEALERHLGARPEALAQLFPVRIREMVRRVADSRSTETTEIDIGVPIRWLRVAATPAGSDGSVLVVVTDITEPRRIEAVRRDFVANASHELKTPAASIQAAAETLGHAIGDDPAAAARFAAQLERDAIRLSRIISDLLDLSRLESGSDLQEDVRLDVLASEEAAASDPRAIDGQLTHRVDAGAPVMVTGSARDLSLMIRNLIDNAIRHTPPGGTIDTQVGSIDGWAIVTVTDTGVGIPTRDLPRVFERFYRVDRARSRETGGTGLGLAIVKHVAENHGGSVSVRSELGQGSTFEVRLPAAPA
jgi:two-component system, OmpR family, sensor histidine kinase SenX3